MRQRLVSSILLLLLTSTFGGIGQWLHERLAADDAAESQLLSILGTREDTSKDSPRHDHDKCAVCHLLAAPRIDRLPGVNGAISTGDAPVRAVASLPQIVHSIALCSPIDERGPPSSHRAGL